MGTRSAWRRRERSRPAAMLPGYRWEGSSKDYRKGWSIKTRTHSWAYSAPARPRNRIPNGCLDLLARRPFRIGTAWVDGLCHGQLNVFWQHFESGWQAIPQERKDWLIVARCSVNSPRAALSALPSDVEGARTESLRRLVDTLPRAKEQGPNRVERSEHNLVAAVSAQPDLSATPAAGIETLFFEILNPEQMPALARAVASDRHGSKSRQCYAGRDGMVRNTPCMGRAQGAPLRRTAKTCLSALSMAATVLRYDIEPEQR